MNEHFKEGKSQADVKLQLFVISYRVGKNKMYNGRK